MTGGAGFLGSHLCERLLKLGNDVLCVDNHFTGRKDKFLSCGKWSGLEGSRILLGLLGLLVKAFVPDGEAVVVGVDDTVERRRGTKIRAKGLFRDAVRSSRGVCVKVEGLRWLSFQLLVRPGFAKRTWGLPFLTVLSRAEKADIARKRRHQTVPEKAGWGMRLIGRWLPDRLLVMVGDGAFASLNIFGMLPPGAVCVARCRMDARFFNPPPDREKGQKGRPRIIGTRQITPETRLARKNTKWVRMTVPGWKADDGAMEREVEVTTGTALWNSHGMTRLVRWVLTRDPSGRTEPRLFVCSEPARTALEILTWYAMRWAVEVTFEEVRRHLGVETQRQWSDLAIERTTPLLFGLFSLVTLWASQLATKMGDLPVLGASWYRKTDPTFSDCLAAVRRVLWAEEAARPILWRDDFPTWRSKSRSAENPLPLQQRLAEIMSYAA